MCGIAGIVGVNPNEVSLTTLRSMTDRIAHRGPDGEGQWISEDGRVGLGHRRLSIIDLSEQANQPMSYLERYTIVFNGEVYNYLELKKDLVAQGYTFKTTSDTEVLMALYHRDKAECLQKLDGMFAFAIYDKQDQTLFCARDRFGEKPFHYHLVPGKRFVFGSEMKAIWSAGINRSTDKNMLFNYLNYGFLHNPDNLAQTFFQDIARLEPAHYLLLNVQTFSIQKKKYWELDLITKSDLSFTEAVTHFKELFYTSLNRRLRSDVPIGSSLSGGLDSSAVVCAIDNLNVNKAIHQQTFSAQFPGYEKDESYYQKLVIDKTQANGYYTYPDGEKMLQELDSVIWHQEEPFGSASIMAQYEVFKLAKQQKVTVLLDGQGADEVLAGYHPYFMYFFLELENNKKELHQQLDAYQKVHSDNAVNGVYNRNIQYHLRNKLPFAFDWMRKIKRDFFERRGALSKDFYESHKRGAFFFDSKYSDLNSMLNASLNNGPMQDLLRYADRNSMAHSREVRLPFLYHELVEFLFSLPATYKMNMGWTKYIMRSAFEDILPKEITWRVDKVGYEPPQKKWMEMTEVKERIRHNKRMLVEDGILDATEASKDIIPNNTYSAGINDWRCWMAGELNKTKHA